MGFGSGSILKIALDAISVIIVLVAFGFLFVPLYGDRRLLELTTDVIGFWIMSMVPALLWLASRIEKTNLYKRSRISKGFTPEERSSMRAKYTIVAIVVAIIIGIIFQGKK